MENDIQTNPANEISEVDKTLFSSAIEIDPAEILPPGLYFNCIRSIRDDLFFFSFFRKY